jgi:hypothetical protein
MKKHITLVLLIAVVSALVCGCANGEFKKADDTAAGYLEALLVRNEDGMKGFIHPDYLSEAIPDDEFYKSLEEQFLPVGNKLDALESGEKNYVENTDIEGTVLQCKYIIRANELFYNVELMIVDNDNGYGVAAVSMEINLDYLTALTPEE